MDNKIKLNAEKRVEPRLTIPYEGNLIIVNEPSENFTKEMITELMELITENKNFDEKKMLRSLIDHCTNVEFDKDVFEVEHLSHEAKMVTNEILIIFQEIIEETNQLMKILMQQIKNDALQEDIIKEKNKMVEEIKNIEENTEKKDVIKKVEEVRVTRKPQRRRKK